MGIPRFLQAFDNNTCKNRVLYSSSGFPLPSTRAVFLSEIVEYMAIAEEVEGKVDVEHRFCLALLRGLRKYSEGDRRIATYAVDMLVSDTAYNRFKHEAIKKFNIMMEKEV